MKRLIQSRKGDNNRDSAILYVNGDIYEDVCHQYCVDQYVENYKYLLNVIEKCYEEIGGYENYCDIENAFYEIMEKGNIPDEIKNTKTIIPYLNEINKLNFKNLEMGFAHRVNNDIYLDNDSDTDFKYRFGKQPNINEIAKALKNRYPDCNVLENDYKNKYKKIAKRLIKQSFNRPVYVESDSIQVQRDSAILYIDGTIIEGKSHTYCMDVYSETHNLNKANEFAFAHRLGNKIFIENDTLENVSMDKVISAIKEKFPNYEIIELDNRACASFDKKLYC